MKLRSLHVLGVALTIASLPTLSVAQGCDRDVYVSRQDDLDIIGRNCSSIDGTLFINGTYSGPFVLNGITNITGAIRVAWWDDVSTPQIPSIELPDLQESISRLKLGQAKYESEAHFDSLKQADLITLVGNYSRYSTPTKLDIIHANSPTILLICTNTGCGDDDGSITTPDPLNVTLPSLTSTPELVVVGKVSSLSLPELITVNSRIALTLRDTTTSVSLPKLVSPDARIEIRGAISSIDMPSLESMENGLRIDTTHPLNISLPLERVPYLGLGGSFASVDLPDLYDFRTFEIRSTLPLDCGPLDDVFNDIAAERGDNGHAPRRHYSCESAPENKGSGVSTNFKAAISVVVSLMVFGSL
ncbi:hypothetical protein BDV12DRAFT_190342 [Aspergillus spectabilis]